jgi:NADH-quinone oxidoreductase subunit N
MTPTDYANDLFTLYPELILTVTALVVLTADLFLSRRAKWLLTPLTVIGLLFTGIGCLMVWGVNETVFNGFYRVDDLAVVFKGASVVIGLLAVLFVPSFLRQRNLPLGEHNVILCFALLGMFTLASSADLITLFIGLELMTMPSYILTGFHKTDRYSNEGGLKYFLLGSFASAILLFGIAWTFGVTGTTSISGIADALKGQSMTAAHVVAITMLTVGATFKAAAVPFHFWTPDAYQGAPTPITGFLSTGPKLGAFALLVRIFAEALAPLRSEWVVVISVLAVLTMTGGNVVALMQTNVKRMLAYSSIAHTGYILAALAAFGAATSTEIERQGIEAILFYVLGYAVMNFAAFAVVGMLQRDPRRFGGLGSFAGLGSRAPGLAAAMTILILSLTGIPPTVGFFAKYYVLVATVDAGLVWLAVAVVLNAALAAFYYLRVVVYMYMRDPEADAAPIDDSATSMLGLILAVGGVLALGILPSAIVQILRASAGSLF